MIFTFETTLTELHVRDVCVRTELCTRCPCSNRTAAVLVVRVQNYERASCAGTGTANAYTKRDIENPFPGTQTKNVLNTMYILPVRKKPEQNQLWIYLPFCYLKA